MTDTPTPGTDDPYDGRGYPDDYEPSEDQPSEKQMATVDLINEAEFIAAGTHDNPPYRKKDALLFIFDHPDYEGGFCVPTWLGELRAYRSVRLKDGSWVMEEGVGLFEELPDWINHTESNHE